MQNKKKKYYSQEEALAALQKYCAYQDRCHQEVRSKLLNLGIYGDTLEEIIAELIEEQFLDEERFARSYARGKFRMKKWGKNRILMELKKRKISAYCIKKAMTEIDIQDYQLTLESLLKKKVSQYEKETPFIRNQKLAQYVIRKGYESSLVWETLKANSYLES